MKLYLVGSKTFFKNDLGYDQQIADLGTIPSIYTAKYKAEKEFRELVRNEGGKQTEVKLFPFMSYEKKYDLYGKPYRKVIYLQETKSL